MTAALMASILLLVLPAAAEAPRPSAAPEAPSETVSLPGDGLLVRVWLDTAGPYGSSWVADILPDGEVSFETYFGPDHNGSAVGRFSMPEQHLAALKRAVATERFFDLPTEISKERVVLHRPTLQLTVTSGGRTRKVELYDPEAVGARTEATRFLAVWKLVWAGFPIKPEAPWGGQ